MESGHLIAMDSHQNLIETNPTYRSLFNLVTEEEAARQQVSEVAAIEADFTGDADGTTG